MKQLIYIMLVISTLLITSCRDELEHTISNNSIIGTRSINIDDNKVPLKAIEILAKGSANDPTDSFNVHCIVDETNDTLLYACNHKDGGWTLYSSDMRVPAIIMHSIDGDFETFRKENESNLWINSLTQEMKLIRSLSDTELTFSNTEIENNRNFWKSILNPDTFFSKKTNARIKHIEIDPGSPRLPIIPTGHYKYSHSYTIEIVYDSIPRMIQTDWHGNDPYNSYCPFASSSSKRVATGSVAISAAQIMYYMHNKYGIPQTAPSEAYCNFRASDQIYIWNQSNYTEAIWDQMKENGKAAAPLIANILQRLNVRYFNNEPTVNPKDLVKNVFGKYGLTSSYKKFDVELLKSSLLNKIPVIIEARDKDGITPEAFIADRYKRSVYRTSNYYVWVYDDDVPEGTLLPETRDSITYSYSTPYIDHIGFNWGNGDIHQNSNVWYPLMGEWRPYGFPYNYNENRKMICIDITGLTEK